MKKKLSPMQEFLALSDAEKDAEYAKLDREIPYSETKPLSAAQRKVWKRFKSKMGRPVVGQGAKTVAITIERGLLKRADQYAKKHAMKRAELVARGLELVMAS